MMASDINRLRQVHILHRLFLSQLRQIHLVQNNVVFVVLC